MACLTLSEVGLASEKIGLSCFGQGQGHMKGSEFQLMLIWMISPQPLVTKQYGDVSSWASVV